MGELIFAYVDSVLNGAPIKQQKITFTNEYKVNVSINQNSEIEKIIIGPTENLFKDLYPECIKNINLLVGINGSGKTTLFNILGSSRDKRKQNLEKWKFFFLYKVDKNRFVIEGNNLSVISGIMEMKEFLSSSNRDVSPEYSLVFEYDFEQKVMRNIKMCNPGDWDNTQILYYQDLSSRVCQWSVDRNQDYEDYEIFVKRKKIRPSIKALYEYINYALNMPFTERKGLLNAEEIELRISFSDEFNYPWDQNKISKVDWGKNYLLATVIYLVKYCFYYTQMQECINLVKELEKAMDAKNFHYSQNWMDEVQYAVEKHFEKNNIEEAMSLLNGLRKVINNTKNSWFSGDDFNWITGTLETIFFKVQKDYENDIANVLKAMDDINNFTSNFYNLKIDKLSSGEIKVLDVFSSISANVKTEKNHYIIVLDEPDKGLHPEMSRGFIQNLIKHIEILNKKYNCTFQFIISTHSPFFISDVPKKNIHCMIRNEDCVEIINSEMGLLSSIPDIMRNTFFLESPFGNVANQYFKQIQNEIMALSKTCKLEDEIDRFQKIVEEIDDLTIKMFLKQALDKKLHEIGNVDQKTKEQLIEYHMKEIKRLRGINND